MVTKVLRTLAKGKPCMVRIPNVCNHNPETTVLAHIRRAGTGMGMKPPDIIGVWACSDCHDSIDRRNNMGAYTKLEIDSFILDALCRQLDWYVREGVI